ncbi:MAG: prolyl oligopeptidase family serine peptidase [Candidatus Babeliales bacterium]|nr:prolyl oligopeptidase family serine peptidase [Candidatus Babeliales bacterium]
MFKFKLIFSVVFIGLLLFLASKKFDSCDYVAQGYKVGLKEITFNDANRNREIKTAIWYPAENSANTECISHSIWKIGNVAKNAKILSGEIKYPLIMFSHGYGLDKWASSWFVHLLASQGYIVVTMDHYGNTQDNMSPYWSIRPFERARDISFVLNKLLEDKYWSQKIDKNRIGMAGYSQGGAASLWIAGAQTNYVNIVEDHHKTTQAEKEAMYKLFKDQESYEQELNNFEYDLANSSFKDTRIKAVFAMAPGIDEQFVYFNKFSDINIPVFIIAGDNDEIINADKNAKFYAAQIKNAHIKIIPEATHWTFLNEETFLGRIVEPKLIHDKAMSARIKDHEIVGDIALDFFEKNL